MPQSDLRCVGLNSGHDISPQIVFGEVSNGTEPIMKLRFLLATIFMSFAAVPPAASYQGLEADYATCTTGQGKVANAKVVQACSRLIKNAAKENETIGMFYALRASANDDKASNCHDARKARELIKDPKLMGSINALESANCGNTAVTANDQITFRVESNHPNIVSIKFFSQDRSHVWPNADEVYLLKDSATHEYVLGCQSGEQICYGAWVRGVESTYWGVGKSDKHSCESCCYRCAGGETSVISLNE